MMKFFIENKNFIALMLIAVSIFICSCFGVTYGVWVIRYEQADTNVVSVACFDMTFTELTQSVNLANTHPISDENGMSTAPYKFKIENTCTQSSEYIVSIDVKDATTTMDLSKVKLYLTGGTETGPILLTELSQLITSEDGIRTSYKLAENMLMNQGDYHTYSFQIWMDDNALNDQMNKTFEGRITITSLAVNN